MGDGHAAERTAPGASPVAAAARVRQLMTRRLGVPLAIALLAAGLWIAWSDPASHPPPADRAGQAVGPDPGRALYLQSCASCHGSAAEGGSFGPPLADVGAASVDFYLRTGRMPLAAPDQPVVPGRPVFDDAEIDALVRYVAGLGEGPPIPEVVIAGADLATGRELFIRNCASCHAATGAGDAVGGGFIAPSLRDADPTVVAEAMIIGPGPMPPFEFADDDVRAIAAYVRELSEGPSPGGLPIAGTGPVAEGFVAIVVALPILLLVVLFVGRPDRRAPGSGPAPGPGPAPAAEPPRAAPDDPREPVA